MHAVAARAAFPTWGLRSAGLRGKEEHRGTDTREGKGRLGTRANIWGAARGRMGRMGMGKGTEWGEGGNRDSLQIDVLGST